MVVLITGGTRGIGLGIAQAAARAGWDLMLGGQRPASDVAGVIKELSTSGRRVEYIAADVADAGRRAELLRCTEEHFGRLDALVNNAGIAPPVRADILDAGEESFELLIKTNLQGPYFLTQQAAKWMIRQRQADASFRGKIVNISSISAVVASVNRGDYCLSKAGVSMATRLWAVRLAEFDIDVFEIRPGLIQTDMTTAVRGKYDQYIAEGGVPQRRWGTPADIGAAVTMLLGGQLPYATGSVLTLDGGMGMARL